MLHCPYCGAIVKDKEQYCIRCGEALPDDLLTRKHAKHSFNFFWFIPLVSLILVSLTIVIYFVVLDHKSEEAISFYEKGTKSLENNELKKAEKHFSNAIKRNKNFETADIALSFIKQSYQIDEHLSGAAILKEKEEFEDALLLINDAENSLNDYHGEPVTKLIDETINVRHDIKLTEVKSLLNNGPNIDDLKNLLWDTESINTNEASKVTEKIKVKIVDFVFSKASEQLNKNQFSDAQLLVEDGLKYAANSEKLLSLQTTIEKEKTAFETAQEQRTEQAFNTAAEEHEVNQSDAIKLNSIKLEIDDQDKLVVKGEVNSIATIPIHSVVIEYTLQSKKDKEILSNKVFVYPEKLYPNEIGKFEYTHYEINDLKKKDIEVEVSKITWYTD